MKIDSTTWCYPENEAGKRLAKVLSATNNKYLFKKINKYFQEFKSKAHALNTLEKRERTYFLDLLLKETNKKIEEYFSDEEVKSLMMNIIKTFYRQEKIKFYNRTK